MSDISKNRANSNILTIALDSVDFNYQAEIKKMPYLLYFSQKSADLAVFWIFLGKKGNLEYFEKQSEFEYLDNFIGFSGHKLPRISINMSYLFHFSQKSADITVFLDFFWKKLKFRVFRKIQPMRIIRQLNWIQWA